MKNESLIIVANSTSLYKSFITEVPLTSGYRKKLLFRVDNGNQLDELITHIKYEKALGIKSDLLLYDLGDVKEISNLVLKRLAKEFKSSNIKVFQVSNAMKYNRQLLGKKEKKKKKLKGKQGFIAYLYAKNRPQIISLFLILIVAIIYVLYKLNSEHEVLQSTTAGESFWSWNLWEPIVTMLVLGVSLMVWRNEQYENYLSSLPMRLNTTYILNDRIIAQLFNIPLDHKGDVRNISMSLLRIAARSSIDFSAYREVKRPYVSIENGIKYRVFEHTMFLNTFPEPSSHQVTKGEDITKTTSPLKKAKLNGEIYTENIWENAQEMLRKLSEKKK